MIPDPLGRQGSRGDVDRGRVVAGIGRAEPLGVAGDAVAARGTVGEGGGRPGRSRGRAGRGRGLDLHGQGARGGGVHPVHGGGREGEGVGTRRHRTAAWPPGRTRGCTPRSSPNPRSWWSRRTRLRRWFGRFRRRSGWHRRGRHRSRWRSRCGYALCSGDPALAVALDRVALGARAGVHGGGGTRRGRVEAGRGDGRVVDGQVARGDGVAAG